MKKRIMDLRIFDGEGTPDDVNNPGGGTGSDKDGKGGNGSRTNVGYSFEQAEEIANARANKAERAALADFFRQQGLNETEITEAIKEYKQKKRESQPDVDSITKERDDALKELEDMKHEKLLTGKGVKAEDMDYVLFKVCKMIDEKTDFAKAAEKFLKENPKYVGGMTYKISTGTSNSDKGSGGSSNSIINDAIRNGARK